MSEAEALIRALIFTPLKTREALHDWIVFFLDVDLPDCIVATEGPNPSNSSPMDMIWEAYSACLENRTASMPKAMAYASRDSFKTLGAAILEVLSVIHLDRDVCHMAAIQSQSNNAMRYVKNFFDRPYLRDFKVGDSVEKTLIVRYVDSVNKSISEKEWAALPDQERNAWRRIERYIKIVIATVKGANSSHAPMVVLDEIDICDIKAYKQARFIPSVFEGKEPFTLMISTRKSGTGIVQQEIENAPKSGLVLWHWNALDVAEPCPASRHRPDLPRLTVYRSDDTMRAMSEDEFALLTPENKEKYVKDTEVLNGCLTNCKLYAVCRSQLATKQASKASSLRTISNLQNRFIENCADSEDLVKAEMLCWAPSSQGLIYYRFSEPDHCISAAKIAEKILGESVQSNYTKEQLYNLCKQRDMQFYAGVDWGFTHNFVVTVGVRDGARMFVLDSYSLGELDDPEKVDFCASNIKHLDPIIFADPESPSSIKTFKKAGFRMKEWIKGKGSVKGGIEAVRAKLWPSMGREPELYFLAEDEGVRFLCSKIKKWHWLVDKAGRLTDEPTEVGKDENDALRYMVMNTFGFKGKVIAPSEQELTTITSLAPTPSNRVKISEIIEQVVQGNGSPDSGPEPLKGRKRGFFYDL